MPSLAAPSRAALRRAASSPAAPSPAGHHRVAPRPLLTVLAGAVLAGAALLAGAAPASAAPVALAAAGPDQALEADRVVLYDLLDAARAGQGLAPLRRDPGVQGVAQRWSQLMVGSGALAHNAALGAQLPAGARGGGENVGRDDRGGAAALHRAFLASEGHRANVLNPTYDTVGIGVERDAVGQLWVTVDFGTYR